MWHFAPVPKESQPFEQAERLSRDSLVALPGDDTFDSFGAIYARDPQVLQLGKFEKHGHTGFAWAARRDIVARVVPTISTPSVSARRLTAANVTSHLARRARADPSRDAGRDPRRSRTVPHAFARR